MLYLILFNYTAPLEALDRALPAHRAHLDAHYASGHFLMSGPFFPRAESREEIDAIVARDPFVIENLVQARVITWGPNRRSADTPQAWLPDSVVATSA